LVGAGVLLLLFVAFQVFGTAYLQQQHQDALRSQLDPSNILGTVPTTTPAAPSSPPVTIAPASTKPTDGSPVAVIAIPKIGLNQVVVQGIDEPQLELGPGHYPQTPLPGEAGDVAIAGHRTTWGHPFYHLDSLAKGDLIYLATSSGTFVYTVTDSLIVDPTDVAVIGPTLGPTLSLTTCNPRYSAAQRLVIKASLTSVLHDEVLHPAKVDEGASSTSGTSKSPRSGSKPASVLVSILWGLAVAVLCVGAWLISRRFRRRWLAYLIAAPFILVALFYFFSAVSSHLPAGF
jgi:sortase A